MNRKTARYPILLLDADDTLFDFQKAERNALQQLLKEFNVPFDNDILAQYRSINEALWRQHEAGKISKTELQDTRFTRFFETLSIEGDGRDANERYLDHLSEQSCLLDDALEICGELSLFCRLYIVTNGISRVQRKRLALSPLKNFISDIFVSEDTGSQKPKPVFFDYVFARIPGFSREDTLIVGDSLTSDIQGGIHADIDTCWLNRQRKMISGEIKPTYEITELRQLAAMVLE